MEVYVDMIPKSMTEEDHLVDLKNVFKQLGKYDLKFNPNKCVSSTTSRNFARYSQPTWNWKQSFKIKAFTKTMALIKEREVRDFLGRLNYIDHFITQLVAT